MAESKGKLGSLFFGMTLETGDFKKKLSEARKALAKQGAVMRETFSKIAKGGAIIGAAFTAATGVMLAFAKSTAEAVSEQIILAESIGSTQAAIAGLEVAAQRFGVEQDTLIDKMREAGGLDAFKDIADQVKDAGNEIDQLKKAQELLGDEGIKLLPILQQGAAGLNDMEAEAKQLGLALSPEQIAATRVAWKEWEQTLLSVKGLARQIGANFMEFFGSVTTGVNAFIKTFGGRIKGAFQSIADFMTQAVKNGFEAFIEFGVPVINNLLAFVDQMGFAFDNLFSFIGSGSKNAFQGIGNLLVGVTEFLATFRQTMIAGVSSAIKGVITFAFNMIAKLSDFIGDIVVFILDKIPTVSFAFVKAAKASFEEQGNAIREFGKDIAQPFKETEDFFNDEAAKILEKIADKNKLDQTAFKSVLEKFNVNFKDAVKNAGEVTKKAFKDGIDTATPQFAGIALSGSVEAFQAENEQINIDQLNEARKQTIEQKKTNKFLKELAII